MSSSSLPGACAPCRRGERTRAVNTGPETGWELTLSLLRGGAFCSKGVRHGLTGRETERWKSGGKTGRYRKKQGEQGGRNALVKLLPAFLACLSPWRKNFSCSWKTSCWLPSRGQEERVQLGQHPYSRPLRITHHQDRDSLSHGTQEIP
eukprot:761892-Hanusia_phi.AAC.4